jgi:hypothetical protein
MHMPSIFQKQSNAAKHTQELMEAVKGHLNSSPVTPSVTGRVFSAESYHGTGFEELSSVGENLTLALESIANDLGIEHKGHTGFIESAKQSAIYAAMIGADPRTALASPVQAPTVSVEKQIINGETVIQKVNKGFAIEDSVDKRTISLEEYDEREGQKSSLFSLTYNLRALSSFDDFTDAFFHPIVVPPSEVGLTVFVDLILIFNSYEHKVNGDYEDWKRKNIIRAMIDPTIIHRDQTKLVPVVRDAGPDANLDKFVPAADVPAQTILLDGVEPIVTAPLAFGVKLDLLGIAQTDALLAKGVANQTDTIDPAIKLAKIYAKIDGNVLSFPVEFFNSSQGNYAPQGNYRIQQFNFRTGSIPIKKTTTKNDGTALTGSIAPTVLDDIEIYLEVRVNGDINIATGETSFFGNYLAVNKAVKVSTGDELALDDAAVAPIVAAVKAGTLLGYDVLAYRTNANQRQFGQLVDVTKYSEIYNVPLRAPIRKLHPLQANTERDSTDIEYLVATTKTRVDAEAVDHLFKTADALKAFVRDAKNNSIPPEVFGVGRFYIQPFYHEETVDVEAATLTYASSVTVDNIVSVILNKIRDVAFKAYIQSEYIAAVRILKGNKDYVPTIVIGGDPYIISYLETKNYLQFNGEPLTLGAGYNVRIVKSLNNRINGTGTIFITLDNLADRSAETELDPLSFGALPWSPEVVLVANISRGDTVSRELIVNPRYSFIVNMPVLAKLQFTNITEALTVAFNNKN